MDNFKVSYAQNREDIILLGFFPDLKKGFYVDVGANHPVDDSVTMLFYKKGWSGINIEPSISMHKLLSQERSRDVNLRIGISNRQGELKLREFVKGNGLSTFSNEMIAQYSKNPSAVTSVYKDYKVPVQTLESVFEKYKPSLIHFLKIDVEGYEFEVLESNNWKKYRPKVICIEANHIIRDWRPMLLSNNYKLVFNDGLNEYYVAGEDASLIKNFSYVKFMLSEKILPYEYFKSYDSLVWQIKQIEQKSIRQEILNTTLRGEIFKVNDRYRRENRIRSIIKKLLFSLNQAAIINIENLNKPKVVKQPAIDLSSVDTTEQLLNKVQLYDFNRYFVLNRDRLSYLIVLRSYLFVFNLMHSFAFGSMKLLRATNAK